MRSARCIAAAGRRLLSFAQHADHVDQLTTSSSALQHLFSVHHQLVFSSLAFQQLHTTQQHDSSCCSGSGRLGIPVDSSAFRTHSTGAGAGLEGDVRGKRHASYHAHRNTGAQRSCRALSSCHLLCSDVATVATGSR